MSNEPYAGQLGEVCVAEIILTIFHNRASGTLDLQNEKDQRRILFSQGEIRSIRSNHMEQRIGFLLMKEGHISEAQLKEALSSKRPGIPLGQHLIDCGFLTQEILDKILHLLIQKIIFHCFMWNSGVFRFSPGEVNIPAETVIPVSTSNILFRGFKLKASDDLLRKVMGTGSPAIAPAPEINSMISAVKLTPAEASLIRGIQGSTPSDDLIASLSEDIAENIKIISASLVSGLLVREGKPVAPEMEEFFSKLVPKSRKKKRKIKWIRPEKREIVFTEKDIKIMRENIIAKAKKISTLNYYDVLECPLRTTQKEIHFASLNLASFYHPDLAKDERFADLKSELQTIYEKIETAYLVLVNYESRMAYDRTVQHRYMSSEE